MNYYKARIYSPLLGRFMQTDPIGYEDNVNLYAYVGNDPINGVDPTGEQLVENDPKDREVVQRVNNMIDSEDPQTIKLDEQTTMTVQRDDETVNVSVVRTEKVPILGNIEVELKGSGDLKVEPGEVTIENVDLEVVRGPAKVRQSPNRLTLRNDNEGRVRVQTDRALKVKPTLLGEKIIGPFNRRVNP